MALSQVCAPALSWARMLAQVGAAVRSLHQQQPEAQFHNNAEATARKQVLAPLEHYTATSEDFKQFVQFSREAYTKNLVAELDGGLANVVVMCWAPGQASAFHAHEGSRCFVKVLQGELQEERLAHPAHPRRPGPGRDTTILRTNQVTYIDDTIGCHRVTNKSSCEPAVTLHVYMPPYRKCRLFEVQPSTEGATTSDGSVSMSRSQIVDVTFQNL